MLDCRRLEHLADGLLGHCICILRKRQVNAEVYSWHDLALTLRTSAQLPPSSSLSESSVPAKRTVRRGEGLGVSSLAATVLSMHGPGVSIGHVEGPINPIDGKLELCERDNSAAVISTALDAPGT